MRQQWSYVFLALTYRNANMLSSPTNNFKHFFLISSLSYIYIIFYLKKVSNFQNIYWNLLRSFQSLTINRYVNIFLYIYSVTFWVNSTSKIHVQYDLFEATNSNRIISRNKANHKKDRYVSHTNTLRPGQNGCHFADHIFKCIFCVKIVVFWFTFQ